jgi:hypothetical protein
VPGGNRPQQGRWTQLILPVSGRGTRAKLGCRGGQAQEAEALRATLAIALVHAAAKTAFDIFGSDLPGDAFKDIFDQPRQRDWREVEL